MKKKLPKPLILVLILTLIGLIFWSLAAIHPAGLHQNPPPTETPTASIDPELEVGSTDGILVLAFLISTIIIVPILASGSFYTKKSP